MIEPATKELIFDQSLRLVADVSYESVSVRDIANAVGIKPASIYNYYESKQHILDHFYNYYEKYIFVRNATEEEIHKLVENGTIEDIVNLITSVSFTKIEKKQAHRMMLITKVIYTRMFHDLRAAELYLKITAESKDINQAILDYGVEIGRFHPFDTRGHAHAFTTLYQNLGIVAFIQPSYEPREMEQEAEIGAWMMQLLEMSENKDWKR